MFGKRCFQQTYASDANSEDFVLDGFVDDKTGDFECLFAFDASIAFQDLLALLDALVFVGKLF